MSTAATGLVDAYASYAANMADADVHLLLGDLELEGTDFPIPAKPKGRGEHRALVRAYGLIGNDSTSSDEEPKFASYDAGPVGWLQGASDTAIAALAQGGRNAADGRRGQVRYREFLGQDYSRTS